MLKLINSILYLRDKQIILNDPVYGFITIHCPLVFELVNHRYFQRLRRIKQLGLTYLVFPGALHTRFQHALGAVHLMQEALSTLRDRGVKVSHEEYEAACIAILLHDIGHGPFSHALERSIINNVDHEDLSLMIMEKLNHEFEGRLSLALRIFTDNYDRHFFHELISSQLDVDRLDYLNRDSFFTSVAEGVIGVDRIIKMMSVKNDQIVFDAKGIYSIENFLIARRSMYWQVYLHKVVLGAEHALLKILLRAKYIHSNGGDLFLTTPLRYFFDNEVDLGQISSREDALSAFVALDDYDIMTCIKEWVSHPDKALSILCDTMMSRRLYKIEISSQPIPESYIQKISNIYRDKFHLNDEEIEYVVYTGTTTTRTYNSEEDNIHLVNKQGKVMDVVEASDQFNLALLSRPVKKYYICYPKIKR